MWFMLRVTQLFRDEGQVDQVTIQVKENCQNLIIKISLS